MATTVERRGIVETKVENLSEKMDELKVDVKDMHDCLDRTRDDIKDQLKEMYDASCTQHAALS
jgi:tetrahydromethanopterin S-methyltransferase subunit B